MLRGALELAGFLASRAVSRLWESDEVAGFLAYELEGGQRRFSHVSLVDGPKWLTQNSENAAHAVLLIPGFASVEDTIPSGLILAVRSFADPPAAFHVTVGIRSRHDAAGFAVFRPKFHAGLPAGFPTVNIDDIEVTPHDDWIQAFLRGVETHDTGAKVWREGSLDAG